MIEVFWPVLGVVAVIVQMVIADALWGLRRDIRDERAVQHRAAYDERERAEALRRSRSTQAAGGPRRG